MAAPKQTDPQFKLRMTPEIKDRIEAAAKESSRSMNAEILARLEESFSWPAVREAAKKERDYLEQRMLKAESDMEQFADIIRRLEDNEQEMFSLRKQMIDDRNILYVLLDADGMPLSWQEIMTHLGEIGRAGEFDIQKIEAHILNAAAASNQGRENEWWEIVQKYRTLRGRSVDEKAG